MVNARKTRQGHGFTLIELMIVISMILILMSIAIPLYNQSILRAKESVLRQDLFTLRSVISQFTLDNSSPRTRPLANQTGKWSRKMCYSRSISSSRASAMFTARRTR